MLSAISSVGYRPPFCLETSSMSECRHGGSRCSVPVRCSIFFIFVARRNSMLTALYLLQQERLSSMLACVYSIRSLVLYCHAQYGLQQHTTEWPHHFLDTQVMCSAFLAVSSLLHKSALCNLKASFSLLGAFNFCWQAV